MLMQTMEEQAADRGIARLEKRMDERLEFQACHLELRKEFQASHLKLRNEFQASHGELRNEFHVTYQELRADIKSMQRSMLFGFFSLAGIILTYAGFQVS
jgi:hypothetical protein